MVWSVVMIHVTDGGSGRKTTSLSFVAFERSMEVKLESPVNKGKLWLQLWTKSNVPGW